MVDHANAARSGSVHTHGSTGKYENDGKASLNILLS
jgi:hypothetical protein